MLISQFMGRLAEGQSCTQDIRHSRTRGSDHREINTGEFSAIQFYSTQTFVQEVFNISVFRTRLFTSPLVESCTGNDSLPTHFTPSHYPPISNLHTIHGFLVLRRINSL
jgi:hypothetical protein